MAALIPGDDAVDVEHVSLRGDDGARVAAIHARPDGMPWAGLVVHPDVMGIRPLFDDLCRRLASHGLAVCAPEPFAHAAPEILSGDSAARIAAIAALDDAVQMEDLSRAADYLVVHDDVQRVAMLGFCLGGLQALKAATTGRFDRVIACYPALEGFSGPNLRDPLDGIEAACPTLVIVGGRDPYTPPDHIDALRDAWSDRPDCEVVVYPEGDHGFLHDAERPAHRSDDAADAWQRILAFLGALRD